MSSSHTPFPTFLHLPSINKTCSAAISIRRICLLKHTASNFRRCCFSKHNITEPSLYNVVIVLFDISLHSCFTIKNSSLLVYLLCTTKLNDIKYECFSDVHWFGKPYHHQCCTTRFGWIIPSITRTYERYL